MEACRQLGNGTAEENIIAQSHPHIIILLTAISSLHVSEFSLLSEISLYLSLHARSPLRRHFPIEPFLSLPVHGVLHLSECRIEGEVVSDGVLVVYEHAVVVSGRV